MYEVTLPIATTGLVQPKTLSVAVGVLSVVQDPDHTEVFICTTLRAVPVDIPAESIRFHHVLFVAPTVAHPACIVRLLPAVSAVVCRSIHIVRDVSHQIPISTVGASTLNHTFPSYTKLCISELFGAILTHLLVHVQAESLAIDTESFALSQNFNINHLPVVHHSKYAKFAPDHFTIKGTDGAFVPIPSLLFVSSQNRFALS